MFGFRKNKEEHRYYCLPGMGRSNRRFHRVTFWWAIVVGLLVSSLVAVLLYFTSRPRLW